MLPKEVDKARGAARLGDIVLPSSGVTGSPPAWCCPRRWARHAARPAWVTLCSHALGSRVAASLVLPKLVGKARGAARLGDTVLSRWSAWHAQSPCSHQGMLLLSCADVAFLR